MMSTQDSRTSEALPASKFWAVLRWALLVLVLIAIVVMAATDNRLNGLHWTLIAMLGVCMGLMAIKSKWGWNFARIAVLLIAAVMTLAPFVWLVCAAFKDPAVLNTYVFAPPPAKIVEGISKTPMPAGETVILTRMQENGADPIPAEVQSKEATPLSSQTLIATE